MVRTKGELTIEFYAKIEKISIEKVKPNPINPRKRFTQAEEDELLSSISIKGILNPIIVYKKGDFFYLLDGQRRYEAAKKLKIDKIPAHIMKREPTELENLSMMFHIHNVRTEWTDFAIASTIQKIKNEIGTDDIDELSKLTSLSRYKVEKYLRILDFPKSVTARFLESEKMENPDLDADLLMELHVPLQKIKKLTPEILRKYNVEKVVDICIDKKKAGIIQTNKEFRLLSKMASAVKRNVLSRDVFKEKVIEFLRNKQKTLNEIYRDTAQTADQAKIIMKTFVKLHEDILNIDIRKLPATEKEDIKKEFNRLKKIIEEKF